MNSPTPLAATIPRINKTNACIAKEHPIDSDSEPRPAEGSA
jgi:hypothetical protein